VEKKYSLIEIKDLMLKSKVPRCTKCNGLIKTNVILFGEKVPEKILDKSLEFAQNCDLIIMIGSSLSVSPANLIPKLAKQNGAKIIYINLQPTILDSLADIILRGKAGDILPRIMKYVQSKLKRKRVED